MRESLPLYRLSFLQSIMRITDPGETVDQQHSLAGAVKYKDILNGFKINSARQASFCPERPSTYIQHQKFYFQGGY